VIEPFGKIAKVEYFSGGTLVGTATVAPYTATWSNVPQGAYTITAKATDNLGTSATSAPAAITVGSMALNIVSPAAYDTVYGTTVDVVGTFAGGAATSVLVNGQTALLGNGTFAATVPVTAGSNAITAVATIGGATVTRTVNINNQAAQITLTDPVYSMTVHDDNYRVQGHVYAPANSAVFVNGVTALVDQTGHFYANSVPLVPGSNTINVTLNGQDIPTVQQSIVVTSDGVKPFVAKVTPDRGTGPPLVVTLTFTNRNLTDYGYLEISGKRFDAPVPPTAEQTFTMTLMSAGIYSIPINVRDAEGTLMWYTDLSVQVIAPTDTIGKAQGVYTGVLNRLRAGNISGALAAVADPLYDKYYAIFTALGPNLQSAVEQLGSFDDVTVTDDLIEMSIIQPTSNGPQRFLIYLTKDDGGVWRIEGM